MAVQMRYIGTRGIIKLHDKEKNVIAENLSTGDEFEVPDDKLADELENVQDWDEEDQGWILIYERVV
jgi:hypothetical protein